MAVQMNVSFSQGKACIALSGRFDFSAYREFREAYTRGMEKEGITELELDMNAVEYMDSSALGMLLLLKERTDAASMKLGLTHCHGTVEQILQIANFNKIISVN